MEFLPTIIAGDVVNVFWGGLFLLFCFASIVPGFTTLGKHWLIDDTLILGLPIRVISYLFIKWVAIPTISLYLQDLMTYAQKSEYPLFGAIDC